MTRRKRELAKDRWRTPSPIVDFARDVMGGRIDLDPATDADNPTGAERFFTRRENALRCTWPDARGSAGRTPIGSCFLNPPFTQLAPFASRLGDWLRAGHLAPHRRAVFVGSYSLEAEWARELARVVIGEPGRPCVPFVLCPSPRIRFVLPPEVGHRNRARQMPGRACGYPTTVWVWTSWHPESVLSAWKAHVGGQVSLVIPFARAE